MQSNRFFATAPSLVPSATMNDSASLNSTMEEILLQLKEQNSLIKYVQDQNDQALCLGEAATRFALLGSEVLMDFVRSIEELRTSVSELSSRVQVLERSNSSGSSITKGSVKCPPEVSVKV